MKNKFRKFCPDVDTCKDECKKCLKTEGDLGHTINKNYLESIGRICLCADCCDRGEED